MDRRGARIRLRGFAAIAALVIASGAGAATELEQWQARVGKSAAPSDVVLEKPKRLCVCLNNAANSALLGQAGVLRHYTWSTPAGTGVQVDCFVPLFDSSGAQTASGACFGFVPLPK